MVVTTIICSSFSYFPMKQKDAKFAPKSEVDSVLGHPDLEAEKLVQRQEECEKLLISAQTKNEDLERGCNLQDLGAIYNTC